MVRAVTRALLAGIFIVGGWGALSKPGGRPKKVAAAGIPEPELAVAVNAVVMVGAGLLLGLSILPKIAATLLIGSMIPTTLVGHAFWKEEPGPARENHVIQFLKNLGLIGGLLLVLIEKEG
jgi:putative oxidoreductase